MRSARRLRTAVLALPLMAALGAPAVAAAAPAAVAAPASSGASSATDGVKAPAGQVALLAGPSASATYVREEAAPRVSATTAGGARFTVTYSGFTTPARAAFQRAVNIWAGQVRSSVPITVRASFESLGSGVLGSAGPSNIWRDFRGAPRSGTWYVDAIANKRAGRQLDASPDVVARFNKGFSNWHFGTGPAPSGTYDFTSVVLHELGHGLGFLGAGRVNNGAGSVRLASFPTAYDRYTENGAGKALLSFPDGSGALKTQLTSGNIFFDSPGVRAANGSRPARLFAPGRFQQGSSYSHLNESTYTRGNKNSLMTPALGAGETIRTPGPITRAVFTSIGW